MRAAPRRPGGPWSTAEVEEYILRANWEPRDILGAAPNIAEFENTQLPGRAKKYARMTVPFGGYHFPALRPQSLLQSCDVFVSIAKMKEHATAAVPRFSMKNCFGITPCTIYGTGAAVDEPSETPKGGRSTVHAGDRQPSRSAPGEGSDVTAARHVLACRGPWLI